MMWLTGDVTECSTLSEAANYYQELASSGLVKLGKTEYSNLNILAEKDSPISQTMLCDLNKQSILNFAKWRRGASVITPKVSPQTTHSNFVLRN